MSEAKNRRRSAALALACASILYAASPAHAEATATASDQAATKPEGEAKAKAADKAKAGEQPVELQEVVVSGIRLSLEKSIQIKRDSTEIVEAVSAEDIGKLPDTSIAEAIARLPGLAAQRVDGRAQVISLRGMAPKYAVTLLNGREIASTADGRSVEYDQFPAELINGVKVYKTQDASLVSQGLSGTVELETLRPLDYHTRQVVVGLRGEKNANGELNAGRSDIGNRFNVSYVDQFADHTIGVALGYAHLDNPGQEKYYKSWWWANTGNWGSQINGLPPEAIALQGFESGVTSTTRKRDGLMGVLEYQPNDQLHGMVDLYYSTFKQTSIQRELQASLTTWDGISYTDPVLTQYRGDTFATGGTITDARPVVLNRFNDRSDEIFAAGWRNELTIDDWKLAADLSYSRATRHEINSELTAGALDRTGFSSIDVHLTNSGVSHFVPSIDYADPSLVYLSDPAGWGRDGRASQPKVEDKVKAIQLSAERPLGGVFSNVQFGVSYSDRTKNNHRTEVYYFLKNDRTPVALAASDLNSPSSIGFVGIPGVLSFNFNQVLGEYYDTAVPAALDQEPGRIWGVEEKIARGYAKLGFDWQTVVRLHGNLGLQYVHADQSSTGMVWDGTTNVPMTGGAKYSDVLPSLNLVADLTENTLLRLGVAKEMARPNMEDMRAGFSGVGVSSTPPYTWSASGGNPTLKPWRAKSADLSLEHYFNKRSYLALAGFYKELDTFIFNQTIKYDFTGFPNPTPYTPDSNIGQLTAPANGKGGFVKGLEASATIDGGLFMDALEGFGVAGSYAKTKSDLHESGFKTLEGLSGDVGSVILYFEKYGASFRIGERYRSAYQALARDPFGNLIPAAIEAEHIVDLQAGYAFSEGKLAGLSVLFEVNNLTDEPYRTSVGVATGSTDPNATMPERYNTYGRQYLLGVTYKF